MNREEYRLAGPISHSSPQPAARGPLWLRLAVLVLAIGGLAGIGALLGRGSARGTSSTVVAQALVTATHPPAGTAAPTVAQATAIPAVASAPQLSATPPAVAPPLPSDGWPTLAEERFDRETERWPAVRGAGWATGYRDGRYELRLTGQPGISYSNPLRANDFWIAADVQLERGAAGLFFLRNPPNDFYRFLVDEAGRFRLEWQQVGASRPLLDWTPSDALRRGPGAINRLAVQRTGDELALFANDALLATYDLPPGSALEGRAGLALDAPAGQRDGSALFDNLIIRVPAD